MALQALGPGPTLLELSRMIQSSQGRVEQQLARVELALGLQHNLLRKLYVTH